MWKLKTGVSALIVCAAFSGAPKIAAAQSTAPMTPTALRTLLATPVNDDQVAQIRKYFGGDDKLKAGADPKTENTPAGLTIAWAIELPGNTGPAPTVTIDDPSFTPLTLQAVGTSGIYAGTAVAPKGLAGSWSYVVNGQKLGVKRYEEYPASVDEKPNPAVPKGKVTEMPAWHSTVLAKTTRNWWVYVPAQYTADKPAALIVCQDGGGPKGWLPPLLDNLIAKGEIPPTVGVFIEPGKIDDPGQPDNGRSNRSVEYDTVSDAYSQMLLQEILPEVQKMAKLTPDPLQHMIFGVSSGGICAFTVAWNHPDVFGKVDTCVGSFTALQGGPSGVAGGNTYPAIIRKSTQAPGYKPKAIKMFQTDGANDLDNVFGNWPLCNQQIAKALDFAGYEHRFMFGNGFHGDKFGRYWMPEALRYLLGDGK